MFKAAVIFVPSLMATLFAEGRKATVLGLLSAAYIVVWYMQLAPWFEESYANTIPHEGFSSTLLLVNLLALVAVPIWWAAAVILVVVLLRVLVSLTVRAWRALTS